MKIKKKIISLILCGMMASSLTGCQNKSESLKDVLSSSDKQNTGVTVAQATEIIQELLGGGALEWSFKDTYTVDEKKYYTFEETSIGTDFRYLVDTITGEVYYESAGSMGELIAYKDLLDGYEDEYIESEPEIKEYKLVKDIKPKLNKIEDLENTKAMLAKDFANMLKNNNFNVSDESKNNDFTISTSTYNKYTVDYNQLMYYLFEEDFSEGEANIRIHLSKEAHSQYEFTKEDDFVKLMHEVYTYVTGETIKLDEFASIIQGIHDGSNSDSALIDSYIGLQVTNDYSTSMTSKIVFDLDIDIYQTLKSKYYKKEYETVQGYKDDSEKVKSTIKAINEDPSNKYTKTTNNGLEYEETSFGVNYNYGKSKFMQTGQLYTSVKNGEGTFTENEFNKLLDTLKLIFGEELYEKIDKSSLTLEKVANVQHSRELRSKYYELIGSCKNPSIYSDNMKIILYNDSEGTVYIGQDTLSINYSIPVIAEGIREI